MSDCGDPSAGQGLTAVSPRTGHGRQVWAFALLALQPHHSTAVDSFAVSLYLFPAEVSCPHWL